MDPQITQIAFGATRASAHQPQSKGIMMKLNFVLVALFAAAAVYIVTLRRQIQAAQMRGDMYRDISARLDRRVAELTAQ